MYEYTYTDFTACYSTVSFWGFLVQHKSVNQSREEINLHNACC